VRRGALVTGVGLVVGVAAFAAASAYKRVAPERAQVQEEPPPATAPAEPERKAAVPGAAEPAQAPLLAEPEEESPPGVKRPKPRPTRAAAAAPQTRKVRVLVMGAMGARVRIDQGAAVEWLGRDFELEVGSHTFEFIPPNEACCEAPKPKTIEVPPGEGVFLVRENIPFKPAIIRLTGPPGTEADCTHGKLPAPGELAVKVFKAETRYHCSVFAEGKEPKQFDGVLVPGGTFAISPP
jgi:hypothetical protein